MNSDELKEKYGKECVEYADVFALDGRDHEVYLDDKVLRWREDPHVRWITNHMDLNDFWYPDNSKCSPDLNRDPISKNDPNIRKMYRNMGYSLSGYYDIFFWEINNPIASEWEGDGLI